MRGNDEQQEVVFSYVSAEQRIPQDHPLRAIREMVDAALRDMDLHFAALYARRGRPSIAPEKLVRGLLLMILYSIRSERQLMEQIDYNLLYRWFVGLAMDDEVWDATVFTKNRERLMRGEIAERLLQAVLAQGRAATAFSRRTSRRPAAAAARANSCCGTRTGRRPIRRRGCTRRARPGRRRPATWGMC